MFSQAAVRCSAVLRRTARIGTRSISPHLLKSGSGSVGMPEPLKPPASAATMMRFACSFTSSSEMRPFGPVPCIWSIWTPSSRARRRTEGDAGAAG